MPFEIRPVRTEEMEEFRRIAAMALVMKPSSFEGMRPEWTLCGFEDEKLVTTFAAWPLTMRFNGNGVAVSGITMVGSQPAYHRRGYLRRIMTKHFESMHEKGESAIAILWASWAAIYQRYGYGVVSTRFSYFIEPRYVQFAFPHRINGSLRESGEQELERMVELYRKFRENRTGYLHRSKPMWDNSVLATAPPGGSLNRIVYEENGTPSGYIVFVTLPQPGDIIPGHRILIRDLIWLNSTAYRAIWENLATLDLIAEINWQRAPSDDPLMHLLLEPRRLRATAVDCLLGRIVDVSSALTQRGYQEEGKLTFSLIDNVCKWNNGGWKLEVSAQGSKVTRTRQSPQVTMPVSTLALLAFGQISATEAARMGRLDAQKTDMLPIWDKIMRTIYRPACADMF
ncbi:MAG: GNAT family N-acetyltransferase [Dehalococcoidales bacterium]|nr:GNAT family N-acetyltransferase [Dehalococcoidales bacterium]